jgi:hypothetical protein
MKAEWFQTGELVVDEMRGPTRLTKDEARVLRNFRKLTEDLRLEAYDVLYMAVPVSNEMMADLGREALQESFEIEMNEAFFRTVERVAARRGLQV